MIKQCAFPPPAESYLTPSCLKFNQLMPNFQFGAYRKHKARKEQALRDLDLSEPLSDVIARSANGFMLRQLEVITTGKLYKYWRSLKKRV
jgi:hypothetical protein